MRPRAASRRSVQSSPAACAAGARRSRSGSAPASARSLAAWRARVRARAVRAPRRPPSGSVGGRSRAAAAGAGRRLARGASTASDAAASSRPASAAACRGSTSSPRIATARASLVASRGEPREANRDGARAGARRELAQAGHVRARRGQVVLAIACTSSRKSSGLPAVSSRQAAQKASSTAGDSVARRIRVAASVLSGAGRITPASGSATIWPSKPWSSAGSSGRSPTTTREVESLRSRGKQVRQPAQARAGRTSAGRRPRAGAGGAPRGSRSASRAREASPATSPPRRPPLRPVRVEERRRRAPLRPRASRRAPPATARRARARRVAAPRRRRTSARARSRAHPAPATRPLRPCSSPPPSGRSCRYRAGPRSRAAAGRSARRRSGRRSPPARFALEQVVLRHEAPARRPHVPLRPALPAPRKVYVKPPPRVPSAASGRLIKTLWFGSRCLHEAALALRARTLGCS